MAKAKSKPAAGKAKTSLLAAQLKSKPQKLNPFELKGSKGHFDTIGRRLSGKKKSVIVARQEAVNRVRARSLKVNQFLASNLESFHWLLCLHRGRRRC